MLNRVFSPWPKLRPNSLRQFTRAMNAFYFVCRQVLAARVFGNAVPATRSRPVARKQGVTEPSRARFDPNRQVRPRVEKAFVRRRAVATPWMRSRVFARRRELPVAGTGCSIQRAARHVRA